MPLLIASLVLLACGGAPADDGPKRHPSVPKDWPVWADPIAPTEVRGVRSVGGARTLTYATTTTPADVAAQVRSGCAALCADESNRAEDPTTGLFVQWASADGAVTTQLAAGPDPKAAEGPIGTYQVVITHQAKR